jgi:hypothetical protein
MNEYLCLKFLLSLKFGISFGISIGIVTAIKAFAPQVYAPLKRRVMHALFNHHLLARSRDLFI